MKTEDADEEYEASDGELLSLARAGMRSPAGGRALEALLQRYDLLLKQVIQRYARGLCPDGHAVADFADDIRSRVVEKLMAAIDSEREIRSFPGLVASAGRTCAIDARRFYSRKHELRPELRTKSFETPAFGGERDELERRMERGALKQTVRDALVALGSQSDEGLKMAVALRLRYVEGRTYAEIGRHLKLQGLADREPSERTVHRWMRQAEAEFRKVLRTEFGVTSPADL